MDIMMALLIRLFYLLFSLLAFFAVVVLGVSHRSGDSRQYSTSKQQQPVPIQQQQQQQENLRVLFF